MHLKHLDILGFKSFAEKTRLDFETGVTSIVGPNGCGKTNVVDAIKWVLGEQSAKSLRGKRMEDIIFHGAETRKPVGMAEVTLTFDNSKKILPLEFSEVNISRRVFRSGESQYFINKNICRLRDIDNLFMDTGVGMRAYSIFEQGKMDLILSSKPEDRRFIFEEAAGITKFKERKRETLHKIEITENNLVRVNDIVKEVQRQLKSIERQAAKARRYKKLQGELKEQEVKLLVHDLRKLKVLEREFEKDKHNAEEQAVMMKNAIDSKESQVKGLRESLKQLDAQINILHNENLSVETQLVSNKHHLQTKHEKIKELENRELIIDSEIKRIEEDLAILHNNLDSVLKECEEAQATRQDYKKSSEEKSTLIRSIDAKSNEIEKQIVSQKDILVGKTAKQSQIKNTISNTDLELKSISLKRRKNHVDLIKKTKQKEELKIELEKMESLLVTQQKNLLNIRQKLKDHEEKVFSLRDEVLAVNKQLNDKRQYFSEKRSEYEMYSSQKKIFEGYTDGVRTILENREEFIGVLGVVSELIKIPEKYNAAVCSVLGSRAEWIVVDNFQNAYQAALKLHNSNLSQTVFLVLESLPDVQKLDDSAIGISALDVIDYDQKYDRLVKFLLGRVLILKELDVATGVASVGLSDKAVFVMATENGVVVNSDGIIYSGRLAEDLVSQWQKTRESNITNLKGVLSTISTEIFSVTEKHNLSQERLTQEERQLEVAKNNLYNEEIAFSVEENDFLRQKTTQDSLEDDIQALKYEEEEEKSQIEDFQKAKINKEEELKSVEEEIGVVYSQIRQAEDVFRKIQSEKHVAEKEFTEIKISLVSAEEKENLLEFKKSETQNKMQDLEGTINAITKENEDNKILVQKLKEEIISTDSEVQELTQKGLCIENNFKDIKTKRADMADELNIVEDSLKDERQATDTVYSKLNERQLKLSEIKLKIDNISGKLSDEYRMDNNSISEISLDGINLEQLGQDNTILREKLQGMGEVSLMAIEEQDELANRFEFLTTQRQDLVNAKESLLKAIAKLNTTTRKMFAETFDKIRENFKDIFNQLFGGGKADLILVDESDILESGIDVVARPPGKRLQNVSLLSGGEKALTAIALLFSIFKTKPSPFCIMDEIDAPLDDSNIERFVNLLKDFAKDSQFIMITHNKRTISAAQSLYGITMQESGVSKIVSVKFNHDSKPVAVEV